jgi:hypothetical protein
MIYNNRYILSVSIATELMTLTYRGCKYNKEDEAKKNKDWWNLAHRSWLCLKYRNVCYFPFVTGGQI